MEMEWTYGTLLAFGMRWLTFSFLLFPLPIGYSKLPNTKGTQKARLTSRVNSNNTDNNTKASCDIKMSMSLSYISNPK